MAKLEEIVKNDTATSTATSTRDAPSVTKRTGRTVSTPASTSQDLEDDEEELDEGEEDDDDDDEDSDASDESDIDDIPDPEKWRIIRESGIMDQVQASDKQQASRDSRRSRRHGHQGATEDEDANRDFIFEGIFFSIPTTCLFVVMDILVHRQFGEAYGGGDIFRKVVKVFPAILFMVYFSNKAKKHPVTQGSMFIVSTLCGCYFLHTMFRSPAMGIMLRAPGIITILVYCIVQLNLLPAMISLAICGLYYKYGNVQYY
ncbi:hypothetical protein EMPS_03097 [Entomortierella parvispora]|uniref:DUF7719 domain-containing protein n=1 Tax=Entomortierella parvispora TaxID=205924 RepID=A0A9P3LU96_9FUNG|nr:hypothetical protein EMPS_03097 [Entomortierella parvispora]